MNRHDQLIVLATKSCLEDSLTSFCLGVMYAVAEERRAKMAIENRNLEVGTRLVATYKKQAYACIVEKADEGEGIVFMLEDGRKFKSPSSAGMAVMGGKAVNGWKFWSVKSGKTSSAETPDVEKPRTKRTPAKSKKVIYKVPNPPNTASGKQKYFCTACMKGFLVETGTEPQVCPDGHRIDDPELTSPAVGAEATDVANE